MWKKTSTEALSINHTSEVIVVVLAAIITPQVILRALPSAYSVTHILLSLIVGVTAFACIARLNKHATQVAPRRSSHQLAVRYGGTGVGVVVAAARILALAVLVMLGAELVVSSLSAIVDLRGWDHYVASALTFIIPVPIFVRLFFSRMRIVKTIAILGALCLVALLAYALGAEALRTIDFEQIIAAREEAYRADISADIFSSDISTIVAALLGSLLPAAIYIVVSERIMIQPDHRRVPFSHAYVVGVPLLLVVANTMYFVAKLALPGLRLGIPTLSISVAMWGEVGRTIVAIIFAGVGLAASYGSYRQLPRLLRELAIDGLLPRRLAAQDAQGPRRWAVFSIAALSATVLFFLDSTRALAMVFITVAFFVEMTTALSMVWRSKAILEESTDRDERMAAVRTKWLFRFGGLLCLLVIVLITLVHPSWSLATALSLIVPAVYLLIYRRGLGKINEYLDVSETIEHHVIPTRAHGFVLIDHIDAATLRAVSWARTMRLDSLQGLCVDFDPARTRVLRKQWQQAKLPVPLTILGTPKGATRGPVIEYVRQFRELHPNDVICVFVTKVLSTSSWQRFFVRHTTPAIITELRLLDGVMVTEVPFRLDTDQDSALPDDIKEIGGL